MPQPLEDILEPRTLPAPAQRAAWLARFLPAHPWSTDPPARDRFVAATGLSERLVDVLLADFAERERWRPGATQKDRGERWDRWAGLVLSTKVDVRPAGRAIAVCGGELGLGDLEVEARFTPVWSQPGKEPVVQLEEVRIRSSLHPPAVPVELIDLTVYWAALRLAVDEGLRRGSTKRRAFYKVAAQPEPGKAPKLDYYAAILAEHDGLAATGHPSPAKELAERYDVKRGTMRGHLLKAREHKKLGHF